MGRTSAAMMVPRDEELSWGLMCADAVLGRASAFREGGGGSGSNDYERRVTDRRFSYDKSPEAEVQRARGFCARFSLLPAEHRDVLSLAYGVTADACRGQIAGRNWEEVKGKGKRQRTEHGFDPGAYDLATWQAVERVFGSLVAVALYLAPAAGEVPMRKADFENGGVWVSAAGRHLIAFCKAWKHPGPRAACEGCIKVAPKACAEHVECPQQRAVRDALAAALEAWGHDRAASKEPRVRREYAFRRDPATLWTAAAVPRGFA